MTLPFTLPAWMPPWLPFLVLVGVVLYLLVFLIMPFSVFGVKSRLDSLEAELDEIHTEIRRLALRLPEPIARDPYDDVLAPLARSETTSEPARPPIPPAPELPPTLDPPVPARRFPPRRSVQRANAPNPRPRAEPRLDWPH